MKHRLNIILIFSLSFFIFAEEAEIILPSVTTIVPASIEQKIVITADDIKSKHYESLNDVVERCGIQMLAYGPYGLESKPSIRGFTDETVRVVVDGICVNNAQYGTFDLSSINLESVEKIEIIRGGFTEGVEDEGAVGGVIYITMKKTELNKSFSGEFGLKSFFNTKCFLDSYFQKLSFSNMLGESTFLTSSGNVNYAANRFLYKLTPSLELTEGPIGAYKTFGRWVECQNAQVTDAHADAYLTHYFADGNYFSVGDFFYGGHKNVPGSVKDNDPGLQRDYNNNLSFALWNPSVSGLFNLKNNLVWLCNNRFYNNSKRTEESSHYINTLKYSGTMDFTSLADGHIRQLFGVSMDYTHLNSSNDGKHIQLSGVIKETTKFAIGKGWSISVPLAAKFCVNDNNTNFAFIPKLGGAWEKDVFCISADVYRMVQFPNMDDLFWEGGDFHGNPNLKPESGWGADLGLKLSKFNAGNSVLHGSVIVFSDYYKDKIRWGNGTTENLSSAYYLGVDFNLGAAFFDETLNFDINGEYLYNRLLDSGTTYGKRIMWTPDFVCTSVISLNFDPVKFSLSASYTGIRYLTNLNQNYLKPYVLVNLSAEGAAIGGKFVPFAKVDNLLNWQYQAVEGYPMPGISLTVGGRFTFF